MVLQAETMPHMTGVRGKQGEKAEITSSKWLIYPHVQGYLG